MTWSVRGRLTAWYSAVVVAVLAAAALAVASVQARLGLARLDGELQRFGMTVEAVMRNEFGEGLDLAGAAQEASSEVVPTGLTLGLADGGGRALVSWGEPLPAAWVPGPGAVGTTVETRSLRGHRYRVMERHVSAGPHRFIVASLASLDVLDRQRAELLEALGSGMLVAIALAVVGGWIVARQALAPLTTMAVEATAITARDPSVRLRAAGRRDELGQLASAFNALLDRLSATFLEQRRFMADASHQMRTPVSVLRTTAQVMLGREGRHEREYRESLAIVGEQATRLSRLVDALFLLSRAEAGARTLASESLYLDELVEECARAAAVLAAERDVKVTTGGATDVPFTGDDELLRHMVVNLLENAVRLTPRGSHVSAELASDGRTVTLRVRDQGPGIRPDDRARVFERFVRLDPRSDGAGLGLPMARWIAEAHGGGLTLESSSPEGSCFRVDLPVPDVRERNPAEVTGAPSRSPE